MDLFTVDTIGEQNLLRKNEYNTNEILYSNETYNLNTEITDDSEKVLCTDDEESVDEDYDYKGNAIEIIIC